MANKKEIKLQFAWKQTPTSFHKADAQKIGEEIGEWPTPESVLEKAKDENTELHKCFEWDDTVAAEKYRLIQASQIIRTLVIKGTETTENPVRAFQITSEPKVYAPTRVFLTDENEYATLLQRVTAELKQIRNRYNQISELESVFEAIDAL